jgi:hypothetical protein
MLQVKMLSFDDDVPEELRQRARNIIDAEPSLYAVGVFIRLGLVQGQTGFGRWTVHEAFREQTDLKEILREALQRRGEPLAP